ncbi:hypothetical protein CLV63_119142 [Murinocardiopsis flavida]|uniref:DUF2567 domain-containing protein n=1 Tax=Murinocardiopsis flavida TaxID=645275 RepID=A0A2P8D3S0_9ACTN|nr:hypothetical protein [Murinocardiopsis flavida]PSK91861.1 hypothetical protein CLV63_119142 [Murinocardiopsis flavida]
MIRPHLGIGALTAGALTLVGAPLGLLWWAIAPRPEVTVVADGGTVPYPVSETMFASEGYLALILLVTGLLSGYACYLAQYRIARLRAVDVRLACLLGMVAGGALGSVLAWRIGIALDAAAFARVLAAAETGDVVRAGLDLRATSALLLWPFVAVLQYSLFDAVSVLRGDLPHEAARGAAAPGADAAADTGEVTPAADGSAAEEPDVAEGTAPLSGGPSQR